MTTKSSYFFNIGILPVDDEKTQIIDSSKISFVLNIKYDDKSENKEFREALKSMEINDKVTLLYKYIDYYIEQYNKKDDSIKWAKTMFSYSKDKDQTNQENIIQKKIYKLGIVYNGFYNNQILTVKIKENFDNENDDKPQFIGMLLVNLGYGVKCVAFNNNFILEKIIDIQETTVSIPKLLQLYNEHNNEKTDSIWKNINSAKVYYYDYEVKNKNVVNSKEDLDNLILEKITKGLSDKDDITNVTSVIYTYLYKEINELYKNGNNKIYILSVPNLKLIKDTIIKNNDDFGVIFDSLLEFFEKDLQVYTEIVYLLYLLALKNGTISIKGGASKKRIPKRKNKYTKKLYK